IQKLGAGGGAEAPGALPAWRQALQAGKLPLADVPWEPAVIFDKGGGKRAGGNIPGGIRDGGGVPPKAASSSVKRNLGLYDVVYVHVVEGKTVSKPENAGGAPVAFRRRTCGIAGASNRARCGIGAGEQDRTHSGDGWQLLLFLQPAEPDFANP